MALLAPFGCCATHPPAPTIETWYIEPGQPPVSADASAAPQSFKPVRTAEELRAALGRFDRIGVAQDEILQLCWPIRVPAGANISIACQGATLDMRCTGSGLVLGRGSKLTMQECNVVWPMQKQFFNAAGPGSASMQLADNSLLVLSGAVQSINCDVRLGSACYCTRCILPVW